MESSAFLNRPGTGPVTVAIWPMVMVLDVTPMVSLAAEPVVPAGWGTVVDPVPAVVADPVVVDEPLAAVVVDADLVLLPHALITSPPAATTAAKRSAL